MLKIREETPDVRDVMEGMMKRGFQPRFIMAMRDNDAVIDMWASDTLEEGELVMLLRHFCDQVEAEPNEG